MNSKPKQTPHPDAVRAANHYLRTSANMDPLYGIGNLSSLNPTTRAYGQPYPNVNSQPYGSSNNSSIPPPLPRRDDQYSNRSMYSGYPSMNSYFSPYGGRRFSPALYSSGMYSGGMYSPYSSFRSPYGSYGAPYAAPNDAYSSFVQMAEESTRPAFESIESVVQVFNSISMMLESTYGAVYSSYSAILGVVNQFSQLKTHVAEIFSLFTMLKGLQWLCLKVLYLLGLRKSNPSVDKAWRTAHETAMSASADLPPEARTSAWPFFMFLSLVVGAPWLMFKLLSKNISKKPFDINDWLQDGCYYYGQAAYDFSATRRGELSFKAGEKLYLHPKDVTNRQLNWIQAFNENKESGLIPKNYLNPTVIRKVPPGQMQATSDPSLQTMNANNCMNPYHSALVNAGIPNPPLNNVFPQGYNFPNAADRKYEPESSDNKPGDVDSENVSDESDSSLEQKNFMEEEDSPKEN